MTESQRSTFNPLEHPICLRLPKRNLSSAWEEHTPFAMYLMDVLRPKVFVELGTFYGVSYCAFCQAVAKLGLDTACHAVDTWAGDEHTGEYQNSVLDDLRQHHDPLYSRFSSLIQSTFDDAVKRFENGSIDLLHIDGYHTYEAVRHDFETWQEKLSASSVVLFHDTNEHQEDFGVWKFFSELSDRYPNFEFLHGHGLGMIAAGKDVPAHLLPFFNANAEETKSIRTFFEEMGRRVSLSTLLAEQEITEKNLRNDLRHLEISKQTIINELQDDILDRKNIETNLRNEIQTIKNQPHPLESSLLFRFLAGYRGFIEKMLPSGSRRRDIYNILIKVIRVLTSSGYIRSGFKKISTTWKIGGLSLVTKKVLQRIRPQKRANNKNDYKALIVDEKTARRHFDRLDYKPLISIILPSFNTPKPYLQAAIRSIQKQYYPRWELCICDDGSTSHETIQELQAVDDERIRILFNPQNKGISSASNQALEMTKGEFVAFMDHDDEITPDALLEAASALNRDQDLDVIYTDQNKIDSEGRQSEPFFKPDWSPEYFRSVMYIGHLLIVRKKVVEQINGFDPNFDGVQDYEFMLRVSEQTSKITHIPKILYHWRMIPGSVALGLDEKGTKIERLQVEAVNAHLKRMKINGEAESHPSHRHRVIIKPLPRKEYPKVSIIVTTRDAPEHISRCLGSIFNQTTYPNFDVLVVDNNTTDPKALEALERFPIRVIPFHEAFNYSRANNMGVQSAEGQIVVLLNNDTEVYTPDWLEQMVFHLENPSVSIVGPMLIYPNQTVQHAGVALGLRGTADHVMRGFPMNSDGYAGSLSCPRNVSAVTGACLMIRRDEYLKTGGFSEYYGTHYQDVDLCLRFIAENQRIVYTPQAALIHYEGATRGKFYDRLDRALLLDTWGDMISTGDPYYNSNFSKNADDYSF